MNPQAISVNMATPKELTKSGTLATSTQLREKASKEATATNPKNILNAADAKAFPSITNAMGVLLIKLTSMVP